MASSLNFAKLVLKFKKTSHSFYSTPSRLRLPIDISGYVTLSWI